MSKDAAFLNVDLSLSGRRWQARLDAAGEARAQAIAQTTGHGELLARILAGRGVEIGAVERHLEPTLRDLMPDPHTLVDMAVATERLAGAIEEPRAGGGFWRLRRRRRLLCGAHLRIS